MSAIDLPALLKRFDAFAEELNPPASSRDLTRLKKLFGGDVPGDLLQVYRHHNGADSCPMVDDILLPVRLIPIHELPEIQELMVPVWARTERLGNVVWLWSDDNSNYVGLYTSGPVKGWLTVYNHEGGPIPVAYGSTSSFLRCLVDSMAQDADDEDAPSHAVSIPREVPRRAHDSSTADQEWALAQELLRIAKSKPKGDAQRPYLYGSILLTPFDRTNAIEPLLDEDDMWTPALVADVMRWRRYAGAVDRLGRMVESNEDSAAIAALVQLGTPEAKSELTRLKSVVSPVCRKAIERESKFRSREPFPVRGW